MYFISFILKTQIGIIYKRTKGRTEEKFDLTCILSCQCEAVV